MSISIDHMPNISQAQRCSLEYRIYRTKLCTWLLQFSVSLFHKLHILVPEATKVKSKCIKERELSVIRTQVNKWVILFYSEHKFRDGKFEIMYTNKNRRDATRITRTNVRTNQKNSSTNGNTARQEKKLCHFARRINRIIC
jgi:hypothetical protein